VGYGFYSPQAVLNPVWAYGIQQWGTAALYLFIYLHFIDPFNSRRDE
jgi:hypothetical protein